MRLLDPNRIDTVEVLKGPLAALYINDPEAAKGIIVITLKRTDSR